ncbi:MAG TPA: hypothetical protein VH597_08995 [Verrucomicrobiae bacterium]|jgi:hypothetical protein|nr:hypothetical protein [Verrucomicrobiae bacterium]
MDNQNESNPPPRYTWPWFVLGLAVLGFVLAIIWMTVLVRRTRAQREYEAWPVPAQSVSPTNSISKTNSSSIKTNSDATLQRQQ